MTVYLLLVAGFLAVWLAMGTAAILVVLGAGKLARHRGDDMEALVDATREPRLPKARTAGDWDDLERQVKGQ